MVNISPETRAKLITGAVSAVVAGGAVEMINLVNHSPSQADIQAQQALNLTQVADAVDTRLTQNAPLTPTVTATPSEILTSSPIAPTVTVDAANCSMGVGEGCPTVFTPAASTETATPTSTLVPLTLTPNGLTPTGVPVTPDSATAFPGGPAVETATATPAVPDILSNYPTLEAGGTSPKFEVVGVPSTVNVPQNSDLTPNNGVDQDGVDHVSKLGQYTGIASPGVYYYDGNRDSAAASDAANGTNIVRDIDSGVCSVQGSDTRINFGAGDNVVAPINEGTFREVETAGGDWTLHMPSGDVQIHLEPQDNHAWMIVVKGLTQDGVTPEDRNISIERNGRDAFSNSTMTGEGTFMSQDMVDQIARSMHTAEGAANSSGADGSKAVNMLYVDANTGSVSVFEVVFDAQGNPTSYKLVSTNTTVTP